MTYSKVKPNTTDNNEERGTNRSVLSDYDSDPVTRYRTCGLSGTKLNFTNTQICISKYP